MDGAKFFYESMKMVKYNNDYGDLEWSQSQMAFHFRATSDKKVDGWDPVVEEIDADVSAKFIDFMNQNWENRRGIPAIEVRDLFDKWIITHGEEASHG